MELETEVSELLQVIDLDQLEREISQKYFLMIVEMFPDVDTTFLESKCLEFAFDQDSIEFNNFLEETMLQNKYPKQQPLTYQESVEDDNNRQKFSVEAYAENFPDAEKYFSTSKNGLKYVTHSIAFLQDKFRFRTAIEIRQVLKKHNFNLYCSYKELKKYGKTRKTPRRKSEIVQGNGNAPFEFYQEVYFILNEDIILEYQKDKQLAREAAVDEARKVDALLSCGCCFVDDLLAEDVVTCSEGHLFCRACLAKSVEVLLGEGKIDFPCLEDCGAFFQIETLKDVMSKRSYEKLLRKLQEREVVQADIPGLESCPFCEYSVIITGAASLIFECLNCKKNSCRQCRNESHIPYSCDEIKVKTKDRTYVEEKMTEALIRNCHKCGSKFIREDGCNKMKCHCGAMMCYICRKPVKDYSHFYDGTYGNCKKCPLWSNNDKLHKAEVNREAKRAINEIKKKNPLCDTEIFKKLQE